MADNVRDDSPQGWPPEDRPTNELALSAGTGGGKNPDESSGGDVKGRLPFGTDIWTTDPSASGVLHVSVDIYGAKTARLWSGGERDCDFLNLQVGDHAQLSGPTYCWEELAEVLNDALRHHRLYRERIGEREPGASQLEAER